MDIPKDVVVYNAQASAVSLGALCQEQTTIFVFVRHFG